MRHLQIQDTYGKKYLDIDTLRYFSLKDNFPKKVSSYKIQHLVQANLVMWPYEKPRINRLNNCTSKVALPSVSRTGVYLGVVLQSRIGRFLFKNKPQIRKRGISRTVMKFVIEEWLARWRLTSHALYYKIPYRTVNW